MNEWEWRALEEGPALEGLRHRTGDLRPGDRVRLCPRARGGDAMDVMLAGKTAVIESIEQDYDGGVHLAVVLDDDPGRDLGFMRQPGHRFFYAPSEVGPLTDGDTVAANRPSEAAPLAAEPILIAGIGNIFLADDGFGVEVARRLLARELPPGVRVVDYGIRALDLAYALADARGVAILIDACSRGEPPGTLFVIEPEVDANAGDNPGTALDAHSMNPMRVIQAAHSMGAPRNRILLLGCEPATLGPEEGQLGLSDCVAAAIDEAASLALTLVRRIREGEWPGEQAGVPPERRRLDDGQF